MKYILNEQGEPMPAKSLTDWAIWFETAAERVVAKDSIGDSTVSTVFLGLDHNYYHDGSPILWETMVFGGKLDEEQDRCSGSREQALAMHKAMVERVKKANE